MKNLIGLIAALVLLAAQVNAATPAAAPPAKKAPSAHAAAAPKKASKPKVVLTSIIWRGDHTTARAFVNDMAKSYEAAGQGKLVLQPFSTVSGLDAVDSGSADIAGSARPAMPDRAEEKNINFYPVAWDALVMITSPKNAANNITLKQLHDVYLGRINNWKDIGGDDRPINLYAVAGPLDGVEYSLRVLLYHHGDQSVSVPRLYVNTDKLAEGIALDPSGLGVTLLSSATADAHVKMLSIEGYAASSASVADGTYPLYSTLFLAARDDGKNHEAVEKFVAYTNSDPGKAILRRHDLVPYADAPALLTRQSDRVAYVDAKIHPEAVVALASSDTPVSAPNATAASLQHSAPTSQAAAEAKDRAARMAAEKADKQKPAGTDPVH